MLLVDDQALIALLVKQVLAQCPQLIFHHVSDPALAVDAASELKPSVILLDLEMPGVGGLEVLRAMRAREELARVPIVMLSATEDPDVKAAAFSDGANDYLVKLPAPVELRARISYYAQSYSLAQQRDVLNGLLEVERQKTEELLHTILPPPIAARLKRGERRIAERFENATVLFSDLVGFTPLVSDLSPEKLVEMLDGMFSEFDRIAERHGVERIKTIGDGYMAVAGVPITSPDHAVSMADMALDMLAGVRRLDTLAGSFLQLRIGMHSGPLVAGVIGSTRFSYDLWGATVNLASRMESHGLAETIQISEATYELLRHTHVCEPRGPVKIKGAGTVSTWLLRGRL